MAHFWTDVSEEMQAHLCLLPSDLSRARGYFLKYASLLWDKIQNYESKHMIRVPGDASFDIMKSLYLLMCVIDSLQKHQRILFENLEGNQMEPSFEFPPTAGVEHDFS